MPQQLRIRQVIKDNDVRLRQQAQSAHGDQPRIARPSSD
jgi:hypothetical protein